MPPITLSILLFFTCLQCERRFVDTQDTDIERDISDHKEKSSRAKFETDLLFDLNHSVASVDFTCSILLSGEQKCAGQTPPESENNKDAWCREFYHCSTKTDFCISCYHDGTSSVCSGGYSQSGANNQKCQDAAEIFYKHNIRGHFERTTWSGAVSTHVYSFHIARKFAELMMEHKYSIGWFTKAFSGMFLSSLLVATQSAWKLTAPQEIMNILGARQHDALLTGGDILGTNRLYSPALQTGWNEGRLIDKEWIHAFPNLFTSCAGEGALDVLGHILEDPEPFNFTDTISDVLQGYITRTGRGRTDAETLVSDIYNLFNSKRKAGGWSYKPVLLALAVPNAQLSQRVCLTSAYGARHQEDKRFVGFFGLTSWFPKAWDTEEYSQALSDKILSYSDQTRYPANCEFPQLRISPLTPNDPAHAIAMPFYETSKQRNYWIGLRKELEKLLWPDGQTNNTH